MRSIQELSQIASRHGVDFSKIVPASLESRLAALELVLARKDVPFPIHGQAARDYLAAARNQVPFSVGSLSKEVVELGSYQNAQHYDRYTQEEHLSWACLIAEQQQAKARYACREYLEGEAIFSIGGSMIPDFYLLNAQIYQQTGWQLATVSMIIPAELFFTCHSRRFFPVTTFMRPLEQDYLQEPDIGHDVAGHVATFTIPVVAQLMQNHGVARNLIYQRRDELLSDSPDESWGLRVSRRADELLLYAERIYWFTVEFGLVMQDQQLRAFGAGILSSPGETRHSIDSAVPTRLLIDPSSDADLLRLATTDYLISEFQKTYFVTKQFDLLNSVTPERIVAVAKLAAKLPHFSWRDVIPGDTVVNFGESAVSVNEKYFRLQCDIPADDCLTRVAIRNLRQFVHGLEPGVELERVWRAPVPLVPHEILDWFKAEDAHGRFDKQVLRPLSYEL